MYQSAKEADRCGSVVKQMGKAMSRLHTLWVDGGYDGEPFMQWVMDTCRWIVQVVLRPQERKGFVLLPKRACCGTDVRLALLVSAVEQRLARYYLKHQRRLFTKKSLQQFFRVTLTCLTVSASIF